MPTEISEPVTLNDEQQLYVIRSGSGYSCWGYDNAFNETVALAKRLNKRLPEPDERGNIALYEYHRELVDELSRSSRDLGTWFNPLTKPAVQKALERARKERLTVRIWTGNTKTGKASLDEHDVLGRIGRSMGPLKIPLLIVGKSAGGGGILDHCVVRLVDVKTGEELYRHRKFHLPEMRIVDSVGHSRAREPQRYPFAVTADSTENVQACFETYDRAAHYVAFVHGHSFVPTVDDRDEE